MKATATMKWAPFITKERAAARAAKEQDDEMLPNPVESAMLLNETSPSCLVNRALGTKTWIMALTMYPNMKAHPAFQKKPRAVTADWPQSDKNSDIGTFLSGLSVEKLLFLRLVVRWY